MHKDSLHYEGVEHRCLHNLYGYLYHNATAQVKSPAALPARLCCYQPANDAGMHTVNLRGVALLALPVSLSCCG